MSKKARKQYSALEKVTILKAHFIDRLLVSDVCDKYQIAPSMFYKWQKILFENGNAAFERAPDPAPNQQKIADLEKRIAAKDAVIVELTQEFIASKKKNGGL